MGVSDLGAICFGIIIGWVTHRTLRRSNEAVSLGNIAAVAGAVGGGAVAAIYKPGSDAFGYYSIGLVIGFFVYLLLASTVLKDNPWLGS